MIVFTPAQLKKMVCQSNLSDTAKIKSYIVDYKPFYSFSDFSDLSIFINNHITNLLTPKTQ